MHAVPCGRVPCAVCMLCHVDVAVWHALCGAKGYGQVACFVVISGLLLGVRLRLRSCGQSLVLAVGVILRDQVVHLCVRGAPSLRESVREAVSGMRHSEFILYVYR